MLTPIDLEEAGRRLGPPDKPWTLHRVEALIKAGHLPCYGRGKARTTFAESVEAFQLAVAEGRVQWPPRSDGSSAPTTAKALPPAGTPKSPSAAVTFDVAPLQRRPPKWMRKELGLPDEMPLITARPPKRK